jgi:hypothetical protein
MLPGSCQPHAPSGRSARSSSPRCLGKRSHYPVLGLTDAARSSLWRCTPSQGPALASGEGGFVGWWLQWPGAGAVSGRAFFRLLPVEARARGALLACPRRARTVAGWRLVLFLPRSGVRPRRRPGGADGGSRARRASGPPWPPEAGLYACPCCQIASSAWQTTVASDVSLLDWPQRGRKSPC